MICFIVGVGVGGCRDLHYKCCLSVTDALAHQYERSIMFK